MLDLAASIHSFGLVPRLEFFNRYTVDPLLSYVELVLGYSQYYTATYYIMIMIAVRGVTEGEMTLRTSYFYRAMPKKILQCTRCISGLFVRARWCLSACFPWLEASRRPVPMYWCVWSTSF